MSPLTRDRLGSLLMLVFVAVLWSQRHYTSPFGGLFPDTILVIMAACIVLTLVLSFTRFAAGLDRSGADEDGDTVQDPLSARRWRVFGVVVMLALWVWLYRPAGFALTGTLGFAGIAWFLGERRADLTEIAKVLLLGASVSLVIYLVFDYSLRVPLPPGFLFEG